MRFGNFHQTKDEVGDFDFYLNILVNKIRVGRVECAYFIWFFLIKK